VVVHEPPLLRRHERHAGDGAGDSLEAQPFSAAFWAFLSSFSTVGR
jgi:hypothetical protein